MMVFRSMVMVMVVMVMWKAFEVYGPGGIMFSLKWAFLKYTVACKMLSQIT